jgi:hypothetical protein
LNGPSTPDNKEKLKMALSNFQRNELVGLFIVMFKAAPGEDYLAQLVAAREAGSSLLDIATALAAKPQVPLAYPLSSGITEHYLEAIQRELAQQIVGNLLADDTPMSARTWATSWASEQLHAGASIASVVLEAAQALMSTDNPAYASAKALMLNRIEVATYYSVTQEQSSVDFAALRDVLAGVSPDPASIAAAKAAIDANLGSTAFILTVGTDDLIGTDGDDYFIAGFNATVFTESDKVDGGAGTDTLTIYTTPIINNGFPNDATLSNIEVVNIHYASPADTVVDASKFSGVGVINLISGGRYPFGLDYNSLFNVGADQKITIQGSGAATTKVIAAGYQSGVDGPEVYAGTLDVTLSTPTQYGNGAYVYADTVNVTVKGDPNNNDTVYLEGRAKVAHVTLVPTIDNAGTPDVTTDDVYAMPSFSLATKNMRPTNYSFEELTTLTLSGNGHASISNSSILTTIDASGLDSKDIHGVVGAGLTYGSSSSAAETIKLSGGLDQVRLGYHSTVASTDTIYGLSLVDDAGIAGKQLDLGSSDRLVLGTYELDTPSLNDGYIRTVVSADSLDQALTILAASANDRVVFHFGGNTYVYGDLSGSVYNIYGGPSDENNFVGNDTADDGDMLVKLVGTLDLDLLVATLELSAP